ncbi:unnamed protein product [Owenia fusiformis]|uniref:Uncharacterized protein n=1 Tax=Owenia fusiformis TaxID=6347 RepID=A0A8J1UFY0_OWEFU|nr:unnamed protein product [Owenia fusiformis]
MGVNRKAWQPSERVSIYNTIRPNLDTETMTFWDENRMLIEKGILYCSDLELSLMQLSDILIPNIHERRTVSEFLALGDDMEKQIDFFETVWNTPQWRRVYTHIRSLAASSAVLPEVDYAQACLNHFEKTIRNIPNNKNHLLEFLLTGEIEGMCLPPYLRDGNYEFIKSRLDRIQWLESDLLTYVGNYAKQGQPKFDGINFSSILNYQSAAKLQDLFHNAAKICHPGAKLVYYNLPAVKARIPFDVWDGMKLICEDEKNWKDTNSIYFLPAVTTVH